MDEAHQAMGRGRFHPCFERQIGCHIHGTEIISRRQGDEIVVAIELIGAARRVRNPLASVDWPFDAGMLCGAIGNRMGDLIGLDDDVEGSPMQGIIRRVGGSVLVIIEQVINRELLRNIGGGRERPDRHVVHRNGLCRFQRGDLGVSDEQLGVRGQRSVHALQRDGIDCEGLQSPDGHQLRRIVEIHHRTRVNMRLVKFNGIDG